MPSQQMFLGRKTGGAAAAVPTIISMTISSTGLVGTIVFSRAMTFGAGGSGGFTHIPAAGVDGTLAGTTTPTWTYASGNTTDTFLYTIGARTVNDVTVETATIDFVQPTDGLKANDDSQELATVSAVVVTNSSTARGYVSRYAQTSTSSAGLGVGWSGNNVSARMNRFQVPLTFIPTQLTAGAGGAGGLEQKNSPPTQDIIGYIMQPATTSSSTGAPDDIIGTSATRSTADVTIGSFGTFAFTFTGAGTLTLNDYAFGGWYTAIMTGSQYINGEAATSGELGNYVKLTNAPANNDAANWSDASPGDTNGAHLFEVFSSPQLSGVV